MAPPRPALGPASQHSELWKLSRQPIPLVHLLFTRTSAWPAHVTLQGQLCGPSAGILLHPAFVSQGVIPERLQGARNRAGAGDAKVNTTQQL